MVNGVPCASSGHWLNLIMAGAAVGTVGLAVVTYQPPSIPRPHPSPPVVTPSPSPSVIPPPGIIVFPPPESVPPAAPSSEPAPLPSSVAASPAPWICPHNGICNAIGVQPPQAAVNFPHPNGEPGKPSPR